MNIHDKMSALLAAQEGLATSASLCSEHGHADAKINLQKIDALVLKTAEEIAAFPSEDLPDLDDDTVH